MEILWVLSIPANEIEFANLINVKTEYGTM